MYGLRLVLVVAVASACIANQRNPGIHKETEPEEIEVPPPSTGQKKTTKAPQGSCTDIFDKEIALARLTSQIENKVFGQPLATKTVINSFKAHWSNSDPKKALLLSFHGSTGTGKTHLVRLLATALFRGGVDSPSLNLILGSAFEDGDSERQRVVLVSRVRQAVSKCPRTVFIIDDADRLAEGVLDVILPFVEYHEAVNGVDYRKASFVLISSGGGREVNDVAIENKERGKLKEDLHLKDFERKVTNAAFNEDGGLRKSQLISRGVIDSFVPFLPLDKEDVKRCVVDHLKQHTGRYLDDGLVDEVANSMQYFRGSFSSSGCKKVASRTDTKLLEEFHTDEL